MFAMAIWHRIMLPTGGESSASKEPNKRMLEVISEFVMVFSSYFKKKGIMLMLLYVVFSRFSEGLIEKIGVLFLLDENEFGGLGLDNIAVGNINGTFGSAAFIVGALLGGVIASKFTLKKSFLFFSVMLNVPNLTFVYMSYAIPTNMLLITSIFSLEKFTYGIGSVALMLYMMQQIAPGKYKTAHYAISTGFMSLCMMLTGMVSGVMQETLGYKMFFIVACIATIPSFIITWLAPFYIDVKKEEKAMSVLAGGD
jgi:PAT family beta-lactamase induction signal transducer AmpG